MNSYSLMYCKIQRLFETFLEKKTCFDWLISYGISAIWNMIWASTRIFHMRYSTVLPQVTWYSFQPNTRNLVFKILHRSHRYPQVYLSRIQVIPDPFPTDPDPVTGQPFQATGTCVADPGQPRSGLVSIFSCGGGVALYIYYSQLIRNIIFNV